MVPDESASQSLLQARAFIREKGLSRQDLTILEEILKIGSGDLAPLLDPLPTPPPPATEAPGMMIRMLLPTPEIYC